MYGAAHTVGPVKPCPPHCAKCAAVAPVGAEGAEVATALELVCDAGGDAGDDAGLLGEPEQLNTEGPKIGCNCQGM